VYALYDERHALQYVGYSRNIVLAVKVGSNSRIFQFGWCVVVVLGVWFAQGIQQYVGYSRNIVLAVKVSLEYFCGAEGVEVRKSGRRPAVFGRPFCAGSSHEFTQKRVCLCPPPSPPAVCE
jgi:hypothetical protein